MRKLERRHVIFVNEYCKHLNASKAAVAAGYTPNSSEVTGSRLLSKPNIVQAIDAQLEAKRAADELTVEKLQRQLAKIAMISLEDVVDWYAKGVIVKVSDITKALEILIKSKGGLRDKELDVRHLSKEQMKQLLHDWIKANEGTRLQSPAQDSGGASTEVLTSELSLPRTT